MFNRTRRNMKLQLLILLVLIWGCGTEKKWIDKANQLKVGVEQTRFLVGDVNNDQEKDTAFITVKRNFETGEIVFEPNNYAIDIEFSHGIPKINIDQSLGVTVAKTEDLNGDGANEIILFSRTNQGYWNDITVWSFKGKKWNEIAKAKAFIAEKMDSENRVIKELDKYYLIGEDPWELDALGRFKKTRFKIAK